ncbi:phage tail tip fiber protein, partial [Pseudomonas tremae]
KSEIGAITDALVYVPTDAYVRDNTVRVGDNLWTAIAAVPAAANGSNGPPNPTYWVNTGQSIRSANAQADQVSKNSANIATVDGKTSATASQLQAVQAQYRSDSGEGDLLDALKGWDSTASYAQEVKVRTEQDFAQAQRTTLLDARVGGNESKISIVETTIATDRQATAQQLTTLSAAVDSNQAATRSEATARADADSALAARIEQVQATASGATSAVRDEAAARADADGALTRQISTAQSTANGASANAETATKTVSALGGKVSSLTTIKTSTTVGGRTVMAGLAVGVEGQEQESQILAFAQRFAILDEASGTMIAPFVVQGGQVFINTAIINTAFIREIIAGMSITSQAQNSRGEPLLELNFVTGAVNIRSQDAEGSVLLNNRGLYVYDANLVERTAVGRLTAS